MKLTGYMVKRGLTPSDEYIEHCPPNEYHIRPQAVAYAYTDTVLGNGWWRVGIGGEWEIFCEGEPDGILEEMK